MNILEEYRKIRKLSRNIHIFREHMGEKVYLFLIGGFKCIIEPIDIKDNKFFFKMIGQGLNDHPLTSYPINQIENIIPMQS